MTQVVEQSTTMKEDLNLSNLNLITVCTDAYPMIYARKLITRFKQLTNYEVTAWCITDRPDEISDIANVIEPPFGEGRGWWNKMKVYDDFYEGNAVYMDIDTVLIKNFDDELRDAIMALEDERVKVACVSDAIGWKNNKYSSSMMVLKSGRMKDVWSLFELDSWRLFNYDGGDQVWTGRLLEEWVPGGYSEVYYMDERCNKSLKLNLKFHLGQKILGQWKFPSYIPADCKIVDCGGRPKPHQLGELSYIKKAWHDVE